MKVDSNNTLKINATKAYWASLSAPFSKQKDWYVLAKPLKALNKHLSYDNILNFTQRIIFEVLTKKKSNRLVFQDLGVRGGLAHVKRHLKADRIQVMQVQI